MAGEISPEVEAIIATLEAAPGRAATRLRTLIDKKPHLPDAQYYYAMALRLQGKLPRAEKTLAKLKKRFPDYALAYQEEGILAFTMGKTEAALAALQEALKRDPALPMAWQTYGEIMVRLGRPDVAAQARQQAAAAAARRQATDPTYVLEEARALLGKGDSDGAERLCRQVLDQNPGHIEALCMQASVWIQRSKPEKARDLLEEALPRAPENLLLRVTLAQSYQLLFDYPEANKHLSVVDASKTDDPNILLLRAKIHFDYGHYETAIEIYERLLKTFEPIPITLMDYGMALRVCGRREEAIDAFRKAEALEPGRGAPWFALADFKSNALSDEDVTRVERYLARPGLHPRDEMLLSFALGRAREDRKAWDASFAAYERGNRIHGVLHPFPAELEHRRTEAFLTHFNEDLVAAKAGAGCSAKDPIFVMGLPRTGSTLVEQILSSHSTVEGTFELPEMHFLTKPLWENGPPREPKNYIDTIAAMSPEDLTAMGEAYIERTRFRRQGNVYFVDKLLSNFMHVGLIKLILPRAKVIEVRKSPLPHCFSIWKQLFPSGVEFSYDLKMLGRYYCDYVALMEHWHKIFPGGFKTVSYEALVTNTEEEIRALLDFCELPFEEACLSPHKTERVVRTVSSEQVRQPINTKSLEHWRNYEPHLGPLKEALAPLLSASPGEPEKNDDPR